MEESSEPRQLALLNRVEEYVKNNIPQATVSLISSPLFAKSNDKERIIVSLGKESLRFLVNVDESIPIISIFVSRASFEENSKLHSSERRITSIYSDPSIRRQLSLIRILYGKQTKVGLLTENNYPIIKKIKNSSTEIGLSISELNFTKEKINNSFFREIDVLLLQNNRKLFDLIPLDDLIYLSYDLNNTGIIGYSSGMVKSGSIATTYHSLEDILNSLKKHLLQFSEKRTLPEPSYPETYQLIFNEYVMRSLDINKPENEEIFDYINLNYSKGDGQ